MTIKIQVMNEAGDEYYEAEFQSFQSAIEYLETEPVKDVETVIPF